MSNPEDFKPYDFLRAQMDDPWKHRAEGMKCKTCMWFVGKVTPGLTAGDEYRLGRCRRHAPTMNGYPVVFPDDWCGDHKLNEASV